MMPRTQPRFFYGWVILAITFITILLVIGMRSAFSVFYVAILDEFGWSRADTAAIFSLSIIIFGISGPLAGILFDRLGPRKLYPLGAALLCLGAVLASQAREFWHFFFSYSLLVAVGSVCASPVTHNPLLANWFVRRRGLAAGLASAGLSGSALLGLPAAYFIANLGWRWAFALLGLLVAAIVIPLAAIFQRRRPADLGLLPDGLVEESQGLPDKTRGPQVVIVDKKWAETEWTPGRALRTYRLWLFIAITFTMGMGFSTILMHLVAFLRDVGFSPTFAATIFALLGFFSMLGGLGGFISDYLGREAVYTLGVAGMLIGVVMLFLIQDASVAWLPYLFAFAFGFFGGIEGPSFLSSGGDLFQGKHFGVIWGMVVIGYGFGGALGPWLAGWLFDTTGSYTLAFVIAFLDFCIGLACFWVIAPRKVRRVGLVARRREASSS